MDSGDCNCCFHRESTHSIDTVIASTTVANLTSTPQAVTLALTPTQNAAITDRERLSWRPVGSPA